MLTNGNIAKTVPGSYPEQIILLPRRLQFCFNFHFTDIHLGSRDPSSGQPGKKLTYGELVISTVYA